MFRKIVSNLSFSPAVVGQLGFYAKRLRKEEVSRRLGLIFVALALVVQTLVVFQPAESANAASANDLVYGGLGLGANRSINKFLAPYDANTNHLKDITTYIGITRAEIVSSQYSSFLTNSSRYSWGHNRKYSDAQGEHAVAITNPQGTYITTAYERPLTLSNGSGVRIYAWIGHSAKIGWFAIMQSCGNIVTEVIPPPPTPPPPPPPPPPTPPTPVAVCYTLNSRLITRTRFSLAASATVANGATISKYSFIVKDAQGKTVFTKTVNSTQTTVQSGEFTLADAGTYTATASVTTSVGEKTSTGCATKLTVAPLDKCPVNGNLTVEDTECQPCPGKNTLWIKDALCSAKIVQSKTAINTSQSSVNATTVLAQPGDQINYTITVENTGNAAATVVFEENLEDVLDYARLVDNGGGAFDQATHTLSWPSISLEAGKKQSRMFSVRVLDTIPATAQGKSEPASYDCMMANVFGNAVDVKVACPTPKVIEQVVTELPTTGPTENMIFAGIVLAVVTYFYARTRQVKKEVRLIRRHLNTGTI